MSDYNIKHKTYNLRVLRNYPGTDVWFDIYNNDKHARELADETVSFFNVGLQFIDDQELHDKIVKIRDRIAASKTHVTPYIEFKAAFQEIRALSREDERLILTK